MSARRKARKRALDVLFEAEARDLQPLELLAQRRAAADPPVMPYAAELVEGVCAHREQIDGLIAENLRDGWNLHRLPAVDRSLLRIAVYELRFGAGVPLAVAIDEAVGLAADLSTDDSPRYLNGVLAAVAALPAT